MQNAPFISQIQSSHPKKASQQQKFRARYALFPDPETFFPSFPRPTFIIPCVRVWILLPPLLWPVAGTGALATTGAVLILFWVTVGVVAGGVSIRGLVLGRRSCFVRAFSWRTCTERNLSRSSPHLMSSFGLGVAVRLSRRAVLASGGLVIRNGIRGGFTVEGTDGDSLLGLYCWDDS